MTKALEIIKDEHRSIAAVLHGLRYLVAEIDAGRMRPDFTLLGAMLRYIRDFPDATHHPKEDDYLYRAMRRRSEEAAAVLDELEAEHEQGRALTRNLMEALERYQRGEPGGQYAFATAVEAYAQFHWAHMRKEEDVVMPIARRVLASEDWAEIDGAFLSNNDPLVGIEAGAEFRQLFNRIADLAPAPLGLGPAQSA